MNYLTRTKVWLQGTESPRWLLGVGFVVTFSLSVAANFWTYSWSKADAQLQQLTTISNDLNVVAAAFVNQLLDNPTQVAEVRSDLRETIVRFHSELSDPNRDFGTQAALHAEETKRLLETLSAQVAEIDDPAQLGVFWTTLYQVVESRNELLASYNS